MSKANKQIRIIVDAGVGQSGSLWRQARSHLADQVTEHYFLDDKHQGIPDVEILDKVLTRDTILITNDRVLHNQACRKGFPSLTLNKQGKLTHQPLPRIKLPNPSSTVTRLKTRIS